MIDSEDDGGGSIESDDIYRGRTESMLVLFSDSYSDNKISIGDSRSSSCPTYMFY